MATTNVLLREDIDNLGARGEIVKVKAGYARNYLLPRKLAVVASAGNVRQIEAERGALLKKESKERATAEAQAALMKEVRLTFERKVGEHGMLYGSVTSMHVADALKEKGYEIDRRRIHLPEAIKETGDFTVAVRLHREVTVDIPITVTGEGGAKTAGNVTAAAPADVEEAAPEGANAPDEDAAGSASTDEEAATGEA
jgi:large subunit ribosomal protein L9